MASGSEHGRGPPGAPTVDARPGYGYEALSAASDGSEPEPEPEEAPDYTAFEMDLSGGGESSRCSTKVNFPPELELDTRRSAAASVAAYHRSRGRSMSAWSDISRSSIRFEERLVHTNLL